MSCTSIDHKYLLLILTSCGHTHNNKPGYESGKNPKFQASGLLRNNNNDDTLAGAGPATALSAELLFSPPSISNVLDK